MSANCLKCEIRTPGCHDNCGIYAKYKKEREDILKKQKQFLDGFGHDGCLKPKSGGKRYDQARFKY